MGFTNFQRYLSFYHITRISYNYYYLIIEVCIELVDVELVGLVQSSLSVFNYYFPFTGTRSNIGRSLVSINKTVAINGTGGELSKLNQEELYFLQGGGDEERKWQRCAMWLVGGEVKGI